jgi:CheY-like chemotaxis protein
MTKRILVVEDQEDNRRILRDLLTSADYEIMEAESGEEALVSAAKQRPDLILMDIQPEADRYTLVVRARSSRNHDFLFGLAKNERLVAEIMTELDLVAAKSRRTGRMERRFKSFMWTTRRTWSRRRRIVAKAEWTQGEADQFTAALAARKCPSRGRVSCFNWIVGADETKLACANDLYWLIRENSAVCWPSADLHTFTAALKKYWES